MTGSNWKIPFNRPSFTGTEMEYISRTLELGHLSGDGIFTKRCQELLEKELGTHKVLLTTSCTHALEMAAVLLDIRLGDEVILPSFTFVSTANAFVLRGARPVFADIDPETLNIAPTSVEELLTPRTRAIVPVHYAGVACDMDRLLAVAESRRIPVVEDNAHGLFGRFRGRFLGTFGALATLSFHETKNLTCGEGGALLLNDPALASRAEIIREKGTNRARFFRGEVDKYTWVDLGSSWLPSEILAAVLLSQLEHAEQIQQRREVIWNRYLEGLGPWAESLGFKLPVVPRECAQAFHMFFVRLPDLGTRNRFLEHMRARGILAVHHYIPLHSSPYARSLGGDLRECPNTTDASERLVRLPFFTSMTEMQVDEVVRVATTFSR